MEKVEHLFEKLKVQCENNQSWEELHQHLILFQESQHESQYVKETREPFMRKVYDEFMSNNMIYYNKTSKIYFNYIDNNYLLLNEDNMLHHVLYFISNTKMNQQTIDLSLKNTIKQKIMRSIRDHSIYDTIPDTDTIQNVLQVCVPNIFDKKEYAKIFLLSVGNMMLKKPMKDRSIIFMRVQMKPFLNEVNKYICMYFCNHNVFNYFKFKYTQDHVNSSYEKWLIPSKPICMDMFHLTEQFYVNLICVCIYYSNRYDTIEGYLNSVIEDTTNVEECVKYFQVKNKEGVIQTFMDTFLIKKQKESMEPNELLFLWKQYIQKEDLFVHVFTSYQDFLTSLYAYVGQTYDDVSNNRFNGYYSMEIPTIELFRSFWDENFEHCEDEFYFEISEILHLFHQAHKQKKTNLSEPMILLILQLYYDMYPINKGKVIHNVKCTIWDKKKEINDFISKENINLKQNNHTLYKKYSMYEKKLKISKKYFTMYVDKLRSDL